MKRWIVCLLAFALLFLGGCGSDRTDISLEEIVTAYEEAGYSVSFRFYDEKLDYGQVAYVQANHPDGNYIYFSIFESEADAEGYKKEFYHPAAMGLFSVIFGEPSWQRWEVYGCIVAQYDEADFLKPIEDLLRAK